MKTTCPKESKEQEALIKWADSFPVQGGHLGDYLLAIPNGGSRNIIEARNLKLQGVRAGVPDLMLCVPKNSKAGLFIEMKRAIKSASRVSSEQKVWQERLETMGYEVHIAYGCAQAQKIILDYLKI